MASSRGYPEYQMGFVTSKQQQRHLAEAETLVSSLLSRLSFEVFNFARRVFYSTQWQLAFAMKHSAGPGLVQNGIFSIVEPPFDFSYADPFLFRRDGKVYVFFEIYSRHQRGVIAYCEILGEGKYTKPRVVLEAPYHLSYPFIFEWRGDVYLVPETQENGTIELYRAVAFPAQWVLQTVLMRDVKLFDPTLHFEDNAWWLFAGRIGDGAKEVSELHLFQAESPHGPWRNHPRNPVVLGENCARPAGRLFRLGDQLVRPGQDSSRLYGEAIWLNRVDVLSALDYRETPLLRLGANTLPNSCRTHSLDLDDQIQVQDGLRYVSRFGRKRATLAQALAHAATAEK